ncbi:c-type cytochrome [Bdellovibrio sp. HCB337]|uniref:c-type cytochrome n=1 Tax=Bdellovibrio sp. HCB337 TaxID=3394358 RepID=UPI0039A670EB
MRSLLVRTTLVVVSLAMTAILFQNCAKNFTPDEEAAGNTDLGSSGGSHDNPHINPVTTKLELNMDMEFQVFDEALLPSTTYEWSYTLNGAASGCALKNGNKAASYIINCSQAGALVVKVNALEGTKPITIPNYNVTLVAAATPTPAPTPGVPATNEISLQVKFAIPAGTGSNPWNTTATVVETFVGQTLVITNNDTEVHQYHTGGKPCGHGSAIKAAGGTTNCVIARAYNYVTDGALYDHNLGTKAAFYMVAYDGAALYAQNCASCHSPLASSTKKGARVSQIKNALTSVPQMSANANLGKLTQRQIEAISFALGGK